MADPLSMSASIIAVLQATAATISYLKNVRDAPQDRIDFLAEISGLHTLLCALQGRIQEARAGDQWLAQLQTLGVKDGPLDQFTSDLTRLESKLEPLSGLKGIGKRITWTFSRAEIKAILSKIERIKTLCLVALTNDIFALSRAVKDETSYIKVAVEEIEANQTSEQYWKITEWLSSLNFRASQSRIFQTREHGTGRWFLESEVFKNWCNTKSGLLWCPGMPGTGKTVLTAIVLDYLQQNFANSDVAIACIYCNYKEQTDQTATHLIASILQQVVQDSHVASEKIRSLYRSHMSRNTRPALEELLATLSSEIDGFSQVFIVVDALDECREEDGTRRTLLRALKSLGEAVNLMVTSRDLPSIARDLQGAQRLTIRGDDQDIRRYVEGRIDRAPRQHLKGLRDDVAKKIVRNSDGMFLLARLHMDSLVGKHNVAAVRRALETLPKEVNETYEEAMERIERQPQDDKNLARDVLSWVAYAFRPLSVLELQHALAVTPDLSDMDLECITDQETLITVCAGLIIIDEEQGIVRLVHCTTQQYFEGNQEVLFPAAHAQIAEVCLAYLSFDVFGKRPCQGIRNLLHLLDEYPLLDYAARQWAIHVRGEGGEKCRIIALGLLDDERKTATTCRTLMDPEDISYIRFMPEDFSVMHLLPHVGLQHQVKYLLERGTAGDPGDDLSRTLPSWSSESGGREEMMRLLLERDTIQAARKKDDRGQTPLWYAAMSGDLEVVKLLVEQDDVRLDSRDKDRRTPLSHASERGHADLVKFLLAQEGVQADSRNTIGRTPLSWAAVAGGENVVKLLIAREDVEVDSRDICGSTPLSHAVKSGNEEVARALLAREDVEADSRNINGRTPLSYAAGRAHVSMVKLLAARDDVESDSRDAEDRTPLTFASMVWWSGAEEVIRLLLARDDVEADPRDKCGRTPLSHASQWGNKEVVNLLLARKDVEADSRDTNGRTPLSWAAEMGHRSVVALLMARKDVEVDSRDNHGRTPLSWAYGNGEHRQMVQLDPDGRKGNEEVVRLLAARNDVEMESKDENGRTPLSWTFSSERGEVVRLLIAAGSRFIS